MKVSMQAFEDQFSSLAKQMNKWMDHVLPAERRYYPGDIWSPAVNLYEDEDHYHIVADLSGLKSETIDIHVEGATLVISGQRGTPRPTEVGGVLQVHLMEIDHGAFCRTLDIPESVDVDQIPNAMYRNGLLWIELPKKK